jgi:hypothetical protein
MGLLHLSSLGKYFTHLTNVKVTVYVGKLQVSVVSITSNMNYKT